MDFTPAIAWSRWYCCLKERINRTSMTIILGAVGYIIVGNGLDIYMSVFGVPQSYIKPAQRNALCLFWDNQTIHLANYMVGGSPALKKKHLLHRIHISANVHLFNCLWKSCFSTSSPLCSNPDGSCQIKVSKVCNMTIHSIVDQYPTVRGCLCAWEEPCTSLELLTSQCLPETGALILSYTVHIRF